MKKNKTCVWFLAMCAVGCFVAVPAHAGIIITEGKIATEGEEPDSKTSSERRGTSSSSGSTADDEPAGCDELDEDGLCVQVDGTIDDVDLSEIDDLDTDEPEGWTCTAVAGGIQYCEPNNATGSSPGAGSGGGLGDGVTMGASQPMGGCQGGSGGSPLSALAALLAAGALMRRVRPVVTTD